ncbi:YceI family protein [Streptomyces coeruleorubidus]|uniref:YceI family protein n=1 Tax=Streptomyces coeruleorubidus TaxID=116188 RepID=UPI00237F5E87|nr:YceI family protein [Streptomyces coeruleorubidus]WDV55908.1 YceI family protein [Streptomyces coeruleorubidus]
MARTTPRRWKRWLIVGAAAALVGAGGPYVYINYIQDGPAAALSLESPPAAPESTSGSGDQAGQSVEGSWRVGNGSQAGYRVDEVLFGQNTTAVGRTDQVTGELEIEGTRAVSGTFTVDLASVRSDSDQRDSQFRGRVMNTERYPSATFELTEPVDFGSVPDVNEQVTGEATGNLTVHGETNPVTFDLNAQRTAGGFRANGSIPITFADYGIDAPNFGGITVEDEGTVEFLLAFTPA